MNWKLMEQILFGKDNVSRIVEMELASSLSTFLSDHGITSKVTFAGNNFGGFDRKFLDMVPGISEIKMYHRCFDPGSLYKVPGEDKEIPTLYEIARRLGISGNIEHRAMDDAELVVLALRHFWRRK
jgi:DNA polymerase III epsilon subunit-like protein